MFSKISSALATAYGSSLTNFGKIQLFLLPTQTMEQNILLIKPFQQKFHITDIEHKIVGMPFVTKCIPSISILNSKIHIKDKYTRMKNPSITYFRRLIKQQPFFSKFYPIYNQERKNIKPVAGYV